MFVSKKKTASKWHTYSTAMVFDWNSDALVFVFSRMFQLLPAQEVLSLQRGGVL